MHTAHPRPWHWIAAALFFGLALAFGLSALAERVNAAAQPITIRDFAFEPASITVRQNESVSWQNAGTAQHTVTASSAGWKSGTLNAAQGYTLAFTRTGTFAYYCAVHPQMVGEVRVVDSLAASRTVYLPLVASGGASSPVVSTGTITATGGGLWSSPATWGGKLPGNGASVVIPKGITVQLDISTAALYSLSVDGTLTFVEKDLNLSANWIMVHGLFRIGTEAQPFRSKAIITLTGNNKTEDIMGMGTKFLGTMGAGAIEIHGARRDALSWTKLAATAQPGASELVLATAANWRVGDEIVLAPSGFNPLEAEKLTVAAISGTSVRVSPALKYRHWGTLQTVEGRTLDERAEVGLLTRDIVIQGDDPGGPSDDPAYYPYIRGFGGHVMISAGGTAHVEGVEFRRMGQTGNKARYPMHWHFTGDGTGQYIKNSSVNGSFHRALVTHGVKNVLVQNNVVYNVLSHAFVPAEDGPETGNRFENNLGVLNYQLSPKDYSFGPDGRGRGQQEERPGMFWLTNPNNPLVGNVVAGALRGQGFFYDGGGFGAGFEFRDNVAHSVSAAGTGNAELLYPPSTRGFGLMVQGVGDDEADARRLFKNYTAYKNGLAGAWFETSHEILTDSLLADHYLGAMLFRSSVENTLILGQSANVTADESQHNLGYAAVLYMTRRGDKLVSLHDVTFANHPADTPAIAFADDSMLADGSVSGLRFVNTPQRIRFIVGEGRQPAYGWFRDDGSLAGAGPKDIAPQQLDRRTCANDAALTAFVCDPPTGSALGLYLKLDETSGTTAADSSPFGATATLNGGVSWGAGQLGGAATLNGTNGWIDIGTQRLAGDFSVTLWAKVTSDFERDNPLLGADADSYYRLTFEPYSWGGTQYRGRLQLRTTNPNYNFASETPIQLNTWNHVALVRSGATLRLYLNGALMAEEQNADPIIFNALGRRDESYFGGQLDDVRIYDRALSAAEIASVMGEGTP